MDKVHVIRPKVSRLPLPPGFPSHRSKVAIPRHQTYFLHDAPDRVPRVLATPLTRLSVMSSASLCSQVDPTSPVTVSCAKSHAGPLERGRFSLPSVVPARENRGSFARGSKGGTASLRRPGPASRTARTRHAVSTSRPARQRGVNPSTLRTQRLKWATTAKP